MSIAGLDDIAAKVIEGHALTDADAEALASTYNIVSLGMVADDARKIRHATRTTFLRVAHVPATPAPDQQASSPRSAARAARGCFIRRHGKGQCRRARSGRGGRDRCWSVASPSPTWSRTADGDVGGLARWMNALARRVLP